MADNLLLPDKKPDQPIRVVEPEQVKALELPDQRSDLEKSFQQTADTQPDHAAKVLDFAQKTNEPIEFIEKNLPQIEKEVSAPPASFWAEFSQQYPGSAKFLSESKNMAVAKDDLDNMAITERLLTEVVRGIRKGSLEVKLAGLSRSQREEERITGQATTSFDASIAQIEKDLGYLYDREPQGFHPVYQGASQAPNMGYSLARALQFGGLSGLAAAGAASLTGPAAPVAVPAAASAGFGVGWTYGMIESASMLEGELAYRQYLRAGIDKKKASQMADLVGSINGAIEGTADVVLTNIVGRPLLGLGKNVVAKVATKIPGASKLFGFINSNPKMFEGLTLGAAVRKAGLVMLQTQATEVPTEYAQEIVTGMGESSGLKDSGRADQAKDFDAIAKDATGVISPTVQATLMFGMFGAGAEMVNASVAMKKAADTKNFYLALGDAQEKSKLRQRLPAAHKELISQITKDGPVENVYIPVEALDSYCQSKGMDPLAMTKELGVDTLYQEALQTGGDIKIPLAEWSDRCTLINTQTGVELWKEMADDVKFSPDDLTPRQAKERSAEIEEDIKAEVEAVQKASPDFGKSRLMVYDYVYKSLLAAGRPESEAKANAEIQANIASTQAALRSKDGQQVDPWALYQKVVGGIGFNRGDQVRFLKRTIGLMPEDVEAMKSVKSDVAAGQAGFRYVSRDQDGEVVSVGYEPSTFPEYFQKKGYTKKETLSILDKIERGEPLTAKQEAIYRDLITGYREQVKEEAARARESEKPAGSQKGTAEVDSGSGAEAQGGIPEAKGSGVVTLPNAQAFDFMDAVEAKGGTAAIMNVAPDGATMVSFQVPEESGALNQSHNQNPSTPESGNLSNIPEELRPLAEEAKKYKTATEFIRSIVRGNNLPKPNINDKEISGILQSTDWAGTVPDRESLSEWRKDNLPYLRKKGIKYIDAYHVTDVAEDVIKKEGLKGTALDYIGRSDGNLRESSVYIFLDPDDIGKGYDGINSAKNDINTVVHLKIPIEELDKLRWDSNYNLTFGTYSSERFVGHIPSTWIDGFYKYSQNESQLTSLYNLVHRQGGDVKQDDRLYQDAQQMFLFDLKGNLNPEVVQEKPGQVEASPSIPVPGAQDPTIIKDVGDELWYNRRNQLRRALLWEDVKDLNTTLKVKEVVKNKVWPRPDYEKLVEDGMDPLAAYFVKQVYDSISAKPTDLSDKGMELYIKEMARVREEVFSWVKDVQAHENMLELMKGVAQSRGYGSLEMRSIAEKVKPLIERIYPWSTEEELHGRGRFRGNEEYNRSALVLGGRKYVGAIQLDIYAVREAFKAVTDGWPKPQESWQRQYQIHLAKAGSKIYRNGKSETLAGDEYYITKKSSRQVLAEGITTESDAIAKAKELSERKKKEKYTEDPVDVAAFFRKGPPRRPEGTNVRPEDVMREFGFRGVNFGNWTNNEERQIFVNQTYDGLLDLAELLNIPAKAISLNGILGLAYGAQGRGGTFAAHFVPGVNEINLTKDRGAGAMVHEWAHALDHYFATQAGAKFEKMDRPYMTHIPGSYGVEVRPEIAQAFKDIYSAMTTRQETIEEFEARLKARAETDAKNIDRWLAHFRENLSDRATDKVKALADFDLLADRFRRGDIGAGYEKIGNGTFSSVTPLVGDIRRLFKDATGHVPNNDEIRAIDSYAQSIRYEYEKGIEAIGKGPTSVKSNFLKAALSQDGSKGGKAYWSLPTELFARAFHTYIIDKLAERNQHNDFLAHPVIDISALTGQPHQYPKDAERAKINHAFDVLVSNIQNKETDKGVMLFQPAYHGSPHQYEQAEMNGDKPRGAFETTTKRIILSANSDASTFLHESAHAWLEDIKAYIATLESVEQKNEKELRSIEDWKIICDWLKIDPGQKTLTREQHEQFARGFEAYVMTTEAPSDGLKRVFKYFRKWLTNLYRTVTTLNVEISDSVRDVMGRMIAAEDEISFAEREIGQDHKIDLEGLSPEVVAKIEDLREAAHDEAVSIILKRLMADIKTANNEFLASEKLRLEEEAKKWIETDPDTILLKKVKAFCKDSPKVLAWQYQAMTLKPRAKIAFEACAELNGFSSADEMATKLLSIEPDNKRIAQYIARRMQDHSDLRDTAAIREEAMQALHNDHQLELLALEAEVLDSHIRMAAMKAVARKTAHTFYILEAREAKAKAAAILAQKPIKEATSYLGYFTAEKHAAMKYVRALKNNDLGAAAAAKRQQMLNHALMMEALRTSKRVERWVEFLRNTGTKEKKLFKQEEHFNQVGALLDRFGFFHRDYDPALRTESLDVWAKRMEELTNVVNIPGWLLDESIPKRDYIDLTPGQLHDVVNAVRNIQHVANFEKRAFRLADGADMRLIIKDLESVARGNVPEKDQLKLTMEPGALDAAKSLATKYSLNLTKISTLMRKMDGYKDFGPWQRIFWESVYKCNNEESRRMQDANEKLAALWSVYTAEERKLLIDGKVYYPELGTSATKIRLICMALNLGNAQNKQKLFDNKPIGIDAMANWDGDVCMDLLQKHLTEKDWLFVQSVWDFIGQYWPEMAALHKELTGFAPGKVEPMAFRVKLADGREIQLAGGYYPLKQDTRASFIASLRDKLDSPLYSEQNPAWKAATKTGHTKERTAAQYPVALDITILNRHVRDVIHDLSFRPTIIDLRRLLNNQDMQAIMRKYMGIEGYETVRQWVAAVAAGNVQDRVAAEEWEKFVSGLRRRTSIAVLFLKPAIFIQNLANPFLYSGAVEGFGAKEAINGFFTRGMMDYIPKAMFNWKAAQEMRDFVYSKSAFMRDRKFTPDYSLMEMHSKLFGKDSALEEFAIGLIGGSDELSNIPMWLEAYNKKLEDGWGDEYEAVRYADALIDRTTGSGRKADAPGIMRGGELAKVFSMFYSFMNTEYNRWRSEAGMVKVEPKNLPRFLGFIASRVLIFNVASMLLAGQHPKDDDDALKWWIAQTLKYPLQLFPGLRDIGSILLDETLGLKTYGYRPSPVVGVIENAITAFKGVKNFATGDGDLAGAVESVAHAGAYAWPYPDQFNAWIFNAYDYMVNGMEPELDDIYRRRPKKER